MYHEALPGVRAIATRGTFDSDFITTDLHYPAGRTVTSRDLVFLYDDVIGRKSPVDKINRKKPVLALSLADWKLGDSYQNIKPGLKEEYDRYRVYLEKELPKLKGEFEIKVVCQATEDVDISNYLVEMLGAELVTFPEIERSVELVETYRNADYVITNRYHGLIAAIIAGTPALGVSFSTHKSQRLIDDSFPSLRKQFYTVSDFVGDDILSKMSNESFRTQLKTATSAEYDACLRETRRHIEILKYISLDIAKQ
jgi:polysaccharide pyruvyl transferase WcaK-like protein